VQPWRTRSMSAGQISGMGTVLSGPDMGKLHAFLATPVNEP
jgi:hypothetical protein